MDSEFIAASCQEHHLMKGFDIIPGADGHALFLCKAYVVAGFLFHSCKYFFLASFYVNDDGARRLDVLRRRTKFQVRSSKFHIPGFRLLIVPKIRFELQKDGMILFANIINLLPKRLFKVCFWGVSYCESQQEFSK